MLDVTREGYFRYYCLLMLLTISDEKLALYRETDDWILKADIESEPTIHPLPDIPISCSLPQMHLNKLPGRLQQEKELPARSFE